MNSLNRRDDVSNAAPCRIAHQEDAMTTRLAAGVTELVIRREKGAVLREAGVSLRIDVARRPEIRSTQPPQDPRSSKPPLSASDAPPVDSLRRTDSVLAQCPTKHLVTPEPSGPFTQGSRPLDRPTNPLTAHLPSPEVEPPGNIGRSPPPRGVLPFLSSGHSPPGRPATTPLRPQVSQLPSPPLCSTHTPPPNPVPPPRPRPYYPKTGVRPLTPESSPSSPLLEEVDPQDAHSLSLTHWTRSSRPWTRQDTY